MNVTNVWCWCLPTLPELSRVFDDEPLRKKATIHQVTTMLATSKLYMPEPSTMSSHFFPVLSLLGTNSLALALAQKLAMFKQNIPPLIMLCPGHTNHYLTPCFYPSLLLALLSLSLFSPFLTNNCLSFFSPLPYTAYKHLARWKTLNLKPENI